MISQMFRGSRIILHAIHKTQLIELVQPDAALRACDESVKRRGLEFGIQQYLQRHERRR